MFFSLEAKPLGRHRHQGPCSHGVKLLPTGCGKVRRCTIMMARPKKRKAAKLFVSSKQEEQVKKSVGGFSNGAVTEVRTVNHAPDKGSDSDIRDDSQRIVHVIQETLAPKVEELAAQFRLLDDRLDALERSFIDLTKEVRSRETEGDHSNGASTSNIAAPEMGKGLFDLTKIQSNLTELLNSGYLESAKQIRETLMVQEWELSTRAWAQRRGVSNFEHYCAINKVEVDFDALTKLYDDPTDVSVIKEPRLRMLARSYIEQAVDDKRMQVFKDCTQYAQELSKTSINNVIPNGPGVTDIVKTLLPIPGFLKK